MNPDTRAPAIWLITDNKPGHKNQLKGLGNRLRVLTGASIHWVNAADYSVPLWRALLGVAPALDTSLPAPVMIVAAGSGSHRLLLAFRRKASTVVLMKPAFPLAWVDAAIIPAHDKTKPSRRTLVTEGVINAVTPMAQLTSKPEALILIGGPSPHFDWDDDAVFSEITDLIDRYPEWRWTISDSRRTPAALTSKLNDLQTTKVTFLSHAQTHENWLNHQLAGSRAVWVTPDSVSMVSEAATSGVPTGLLNLPARSNSRVANGIHRLAEQGWVYFWQDHSRVMTEHPEHHVRLWEADRAARWLIQRFKSLSQVANKEALH
ncbi:mitochondrial fission ELM1 family protein [Marinobacter litoralis]|uniref:mitochondrial fission ELM1 family protein n=1 Tax=Marinobacter litoralis TaxID=187981 RepID=UPI0018EDA254|nr:ELM1/GtrOC1 family putative glycosyltransferase [Marinobacter litoralis]MBJ6138721.1 mitochondrial fission ELM1 family protein [Marinobacter litoralis]